jgi:hypothetical protein
MYFDWIMLPFVLKKSPFNMQVLHISETIEDTKLKLDKYICGHK